MTILETIRKVVETARSKGWNVRVDAWNTSKVCFDFQLQASHGQIFSFSAKMQHGDIDTLIVWIEQSYESFGPKRDARRRINEDRYGRNGASSHIEDIVSDMKEIEGQLYELLKALTILSDNVKHIKGKAGIENTPPIIVAAIQQQLPPHTKFWHFCGYRCTMAR